MNIDLASINKEEFHIKESIISGDKCFLVYPKLNPIWTKENEIFRSSIWNEKGEPVSLGFKKFTNWNEKPDTFPNPLSLKNTNILEKTDGSLLIVSMCVNSKREDPALPFREIYKKQLIIRTRKTFDAREHSNGYEIDFLIEKYPHVFNCDSLATGSLLFEWTTPTNQIIINYGNEPELTLIGFVNHKDYSYASQIDLNSIAKEIKVKRPAQYKYDSISNMIKAVGSFKNLEGVCIYYNHDQSIKKVKGIEYLKKHAFKSEMSLKNLIEYFIQVDRPKYKEFLNVIEKEFDFEICGMAMPIVSKICDAMKEVELIIKGMKAFITKLNGITRKEQASKIISAYGKTARAGFVFTILDGKSLGAKEYKKLLYQVMC